MKTLTKPLTADDILKGEFQTDDGKRKCAMRWIRDVTGYGDATDDDVFLKRFRALVEYEGVGITAWNDATDPDIVAAALNQFFIAEGVLKA